MGIRALFSGVSGLRSHDLWLDVTGNNLANVNTVGFKASRVTFADSFSQVLFSGSGSRAVAGLGGVNPLAVGTGTRTNSIQTLFQQGAALTTTHALDLSIEGDGFFLVERGSERFLSRAGNLSLDSEGFLVDANGGRILGANASLRHTTRALNSFSTTPGQPAEITDADLVLGSGGISGLSAIRIDPDFVLPPKATTQIRFQGNLDSFHRTTDPGGIYNLHPNGNPILPLGTSIAVFGPGGLNPFKAAPNLLGLAPLEFSLDQVGNLAAYNFGPTPSLADPVVLGGINLGFVTAFNTYAWDQSPPLPPAHQIVTTVFDSLGNPREVTVQFYQVNDLGEQGVNPEPGPSQVAYAWYAFETTGNQAPATSNLLGGTGIFEGDLSGVFGFGYDRGMLGNIFIGDLIYFNTDGSLASGGATFGIPPGNPFGLPPTPAQQTRPRIYLPPLNTLPPDPRFPTMGAEILSIELDFGTFGTLGNGRRDGLFSDAQGTTEIVNGVSTYRPVHTARAESQNGYPDGVLKGLSVDPDGTIRGSFSNGREAELARVALARPDNPEGLARAGNGYFRESANSGSLFVGSGGRGGLGTVRGFSLEASNVDLTAELSNMILAQRGFEVNARTVDSAARELEVLAGLGG